MGWEVQMNSQVFSISWEAGSLELWLFGQAMQIEKAGLCMLEMIEMLDWSSAEEPLCA